MRLEGFGDYGVKSEIRGSIFCQEICVEASFQGITKELDNNEMAFQAIKMINSRLSQSLASRIFHFFVQLTKNRVSNIIFALTFSLFHSNSCLILFSRSPDVIYDPKTVAL